MAKKSKSKKKQKPPKPKVKLGTPEAFFNRELSWLEFNQRVLDEGLDPALPLLERLKFLAIVSSNLDEFFMIRVAGLMQQRSARVRQRDIAGMTPAQQLAAIGRRVHRMVADQAAGIRDVVARLKEHGLTILEPADWTADHRKHLLSHFKSEILPVLTPLAIQQIDPAPLLPGLGLNVALLLRGTDDAGEPVEHTVAVPVPKLFPRFLGVPAREGVALARIEDVIAMGAGALFPGTEVRGTGVFRITRDADVAIEDDEAGDLLQVIEQAMLARRRRAAVRLEVSAGCPARVRSWLTEWLGLRRNEVYAVDGMLDAAALTEVAAREGFDHLRAAEWPPQPPKDLLGFDDLWEAVQDHDVLLFHPYESFEPVVRLVEQAAEDPGTLAIKQTLYRTSGESPIIAGLERAARAGKQVTVLVELKARFDEQQNVGWARRLEDAGCHVIYGIAGYKTHSKALLIVRRERGRIRRYVHLATGNYNDRTARLYSDIGLMTRDSDMAADVSAFFNLLTGSSESVGWSKLSVAPTGLRQRFLDLIDREVRTATPERPGLIMAKVNSLQDRGIIEALYRASRAGVRVLLNVRGICCLRPGLPRLSETIEVHSIVDRFLEHARVFYFLNGGHDEVYLGSADWMRRNLDRRLELLFPVTDRRLRERLADALRTFMADNVKGSRLRGDGSWERIETRGEPVRAQEALYREAVAAARQGAEQSRFRPLTRPQQ